MRKKIIAGNWKMNKTTNATTALIEEIKVELAGVTGVEVVVCPPATALKDAAQALQGSMIGLGAQNVHWAENGAYTGEISTAMLQDIGVNYVIIGHSERRQYFGETNTSVNQRVKAALAAHLIPLVCVGETLAERDNHQMEAVVISQIKEGLAGLSDELRQVVVAYEPVWAIGTGRTATPAQAQEVHALIRRTLAEISTSAIADSMRIQYGGSMKPDNAVELMSQPDIDGGLIGGAALQAASFAAIVKAACVKSAQMLLLLATMAISGALAQETNRLADVVTIPDAASSTQKEFTYKTTLREQISNYTIYDVQYPSPLTSAHEANNTVHAELYMPMGLTPQSGMPAVVLMHILNGDFALCRMICSKLSEAGIVAMFFMQPYYGARAGIVGRRAILENVDALVSSFDQSTADARRAFDVVQSLPGVDPAKIGVAGISLGALRAGALCAYEPRIKRAYLALVAGDLKQLIMSPSRETKDMREFIEKLSAEEQARVWQCVLQQDPMNAIPQLRTLAANKRLRMVRAENDEIMPPACSLKLFNAVASPDSEICLEGLGHYSALAGLAGIMHDIISFFAADLPANWSPAVHKQTTAPIEMFSAILKDVVTLLTATPKENCTHMMGMRANFKMEEKEYKFNFDIALGSNGRFKFIGNFPEIGQTGMGRGDFPWIIGGQKQVFCGTLSADPTRTITSLFLDPQALLRYRMATGLMSAAALAPELINNYATLTEIPDGPNTRILCLNGTGKPSKGEIKLSFDKTGGQLLKAVWTTRKSSGQIDFTHWQINAATDNSVFEPATDLTQQNVLQQDVLQMFASSLQFIMEYFE